VQIISVIQVNAANSFCALFVNHLVIRLFVAAQPHLALLYAAAKP
jgi:hypothetical protein